MNTKGTRIKPETKSKKKVRKRVSAFSNDRTGKKELLVPVGNTAPWTTGSIPYGKTNSKANAPRKPKKWGTGKRVNKKKPVRNPVPRNRAPRARTPIMGNTNNAGMWGI